MWLVQTGTFKLSISANSFSEFHAFLAVVRVTRVCHRQPLRRQPRARVHRKYRMAYRYDDYADPTDRHRLLGNAEKISENATIGACCVSGEFVAAHLPHRVRRLQRYAHAFA